MNNGVHYLKCWPEFFKAMMEGIKKFDVRINDRGFKVEDILIEEEWFPPPNFQGVYSGRYLARTVIYVLTGGRFGLEEGYIVLGME